MAGAEASAHLFETLNPAAREQLAYEGLAPEIGAVRDFEIRWGSPEFEARTTPSLLVERRLLHEQLRRSLNDAGIPVFVRSVQTPVKISEGWRISVGSQVFEARLLADATGRRGMARRLRRRGPPLIGLHTVWSGVDLPRSVRVEATADAWIWGAPTPGGRFALSIFEDPRRQEDLAARVEQVVTRAGVMKGTANLCMVGNIVAQDATPSEGKTTDQMLLLFHVGDAALTLDPLSSSGVHSAVQSAIDTASAIHTLIQEPSAAALVADFLDRRLARRAARHAAYTGSFYRAAAESFETPFWTDRAGPALLPPPVAEPAWNQQVSISPETQLRDEPCLVGSRIAVRRVVVLPAAAEPVAFVEGVEIASLFDYLLSDKTPGEIISKWSTSLGEPSAVQLFSWAWRAGVLISKPARSVFGSMQSTTSI
jgi:2-polyprenyl-6-methoxyphenol hydroxylase-like FAD-dependent oxidoreductase